MKQVYLMLLLMLGLSAPMPLIAAEQEGGEQQATQQDAQKPAEETKPAEEVAPAEKKKGKKKEGGDKEPGCD